MKIRPGRLAPAASMVAAPGAVMAHSPIKGIDDLYNGVLHPAFVPAHLLSLLALGLLLGQRGPKDSQAAIIAFLAAAAAGLVAAGFSPGIDVEAALLTSAVLLGLLTALDAPIAVHWSAVIAAFTGLLIGLDSAPQELTGKAELAFLFGSGIGIYLLFLYPMGLAEYFGHRPWQRVGVRVLGSWVAASGILVLSLSLAAAS